MEKETTVASFDFGPNGKIELTPTKFIGSVMSTPTVASQGGARMASLKGVKAEFRVKLNQVQNIELQPPKTNAGKVGTLLIAGLWIGLAPVGIFAGFGFVLGLMFGGFSASAVMALIGALLGVGAMIWFFVWYWKKLGGTYLVFSVDGRDVSVGCAGERFAELSEFVQTVKKTQIAYLDSVE